MLFKREQLPKSSSEIQLTELASCNTQGNGFREA